MKRKYVRKHFEGTLNPIYHKYGLFKTLPRFRAPYYHFHIQIYELQKDRRGNWRLVDVGMYCRIMPLKKIRLIEQELRERLVEQTDCSKKCTYDDSPLQFKTPMPNICAKCERYKKDHIGYVWAPVFGKTENPYCSQCDLHARSLKIERYPPERCPYDLEIILGTQDLDKS